MVGVCVLLVVRLIHLIGEKYVACILFHHKTVEQCIFRDPDTKYSSCFVKLSHEAACHDTSPRPDLLDEWRNSLQAKLPDWRIEWAPHVKGKDKMVQVRTSANSPIPKQQGTTFAEAVKQALAAKGLSVSDCFFQEPNLVLVTFATFKDHDIASSPDFNLIVQVGQLISLSIVPV